MWMGLFQSRRLVLDHVRRHQLMVKSSVAYAFHSNVTLFKKHAPLAKAVKQKPIITIWKSSPHFVYLDTTLVGQLLIHLFRGHPHRKSSGTCIACPAHGKDLTLTSLLPFIPPFRCFSDREVPVYH